MKNITFNNTDINTKQDKIIKQKQAYIINTFIQSLYTYM